MGLRVRRSEVEGFVGGQNPVLDEKARGLEVLLASVERFVDDTELKGLGWSSAKEYLRLVFVPLVRGLIEAGEQLRAANDKVLAALRQHISEEQLDEDALEGHLRCLRQQRQHVQQLRRQKYYGMNMASAHDIEVESAIAREIREVERHLQCLRDFAVSVKGVYGSAGRCVERVRHGAAGASGHGSGRVVGGRFSVSGMDLGWIEAVNRAWDEGDGAYHRRMVTRLLGYDVYVIFELDGQGNIGARWQLEKDGVGVKDEELYRYLREYGLELGPGIVKIMPRDQWDEKVREFRRQGVDYETGGDVGWLPAAGQRVEDGLKWLEETGLADLLGLVPAVGVVPRIVRHLGVATKLDKLNSEGAAKGLPKSLRDIKLDPEVEHSAGILSQKFNAELSKTQNGKGLRFNIENKKGLDINVRVMNADSGNHGKSYYKISVDNKGAVNRWGKIVDEENNHIDIDSISMEKVADLIDKLLKDWKGMQ